MRAQDRKVPIDQLPGALVNILAAGPREIRELARELGYSVGPVLARLEQLAIEQRAHRRRVQINTWTGICYHWYLGPDANAPVVLDGAHAQDRPSLTQQVIVPFQSTVRTYPAINRRDPLVAALFGPSRQAAT